MVYLVASNIRVNRSGRTYLQYTVNKQIRWLDDSQVPNLKEVEGRRTGASLRNK